VEEDHRSRLGALHNVDGVVVSLHASALAVNPNLTSSISEVGLRQQLAYYHLVAFVACHQAWSSMAVHHEVGTEAWDKSEELPFGSSYSCSSSWIVHQLRFPLTDSSSAKLTCRPHPLKILLLTPPINLIEYPVVAEQSLPRWGHPLYCSSLTTWLSPFRRSGRQ
jgi:hypothetical protein